MCQTGLGIFVDVVETIKLNRFLHGINIEIVKKILSCPTERHLLRSFTAVATSTVLFSKDTAPSAALT